MGLFSIWPQIIPWKPKRDFSQPKLRNLRRLNSLINLVTAWILTLLFTLEKIHSIFHIWILKRLKITLWKPGSGLLVIRVDFLLLNLEINASSQVQKTLLNIVGTLGRNFHVNKPIFLSVTRGLCKRDLPLRLHVCFVTYQENRSVSLSIGFALS